jgi:hypothetical protein
MSYFNLAFTVSSGVQLEQDSVWPSSCFQQAEVSGETVSVDILCNLIVVLRDRLFSYEVAFCFPRSAAFVPHKGSNHSLEWTELKNWEEIEAALKRGGMPASSSPTASRR